MTEGDRGRESDSRAGKCTNVPLCTVPPEGVGGTNQSMFTPYFAPLAMIVSGLKEEVGTTVGPGQLQRHPSKCIRR